MNKYSKKSRTRLDSCHPLIIMLFESVLKDHDHSILEGHRPEERHNEYLRQGRTKVTYDKTKHRFKPSRAVDATPYPIPKNWGKDDPEELARFYYFAGIVMGRAEAMGIPLRWGGDWDGDDSFKDQTFDDLVHFELVGDL